MWIHSQMELGSLGVLITAKRKGYLKIIKPIIDKIQKTNFRISKELIERLIDEVNES
jgi:predicted nucleic acid-binding protein